MADEQIPEGWSRSADTAAWAGAAWIAVDGAQAKVSAPDANGTRAAFVVAALGNVIVHVTILGPDGASMREACDRVIRAVPAAREAAAACQSALFHRKRGADGEQEEA